MAFPVDLTFAGPLLKGVGGMLADLHPASFGVPWFPTLAPATTQSTVIPPGLELCPRVRGTFGDISACPPTPSNPPFGGGRLREGRGAEIVEETQGM